MALRVFTSARAAFESVRGTDLTSTRLIYAEEFSTEQTFRTVRPEELRNSYEGWFSASAGVETNTFHMAGRMSYDDMIWYGNLFFGPLASGTGGGADKTWTFPISNSADNVKTAKIELGYADTIDATHPATRLNYVLGSTLNLHYEKNDDGALTFAADFLAASSATQISAFSGSLSDRTVIAASAAATAVYLDASTIGTTADTNVQSVDFTLDLQPVPYYGLNGSNAATAVYRPNHRKWTATIVRQFANDTEWDIYVSKAERKMRLRTTGPALGGSNYKIDLDLYGVYTNRTWSDTDGIITETLTMEPFYDTGISGSMALVVVNATTSIT